MITGATRSRAAAWLACAHTSPNDAQRQWQADALVMLPLGGLFDAVRLPAEVVHAAAASEDHENVAAYLAEVLDGPVIHDPCTWYYALVPPQTTATWRSPFARCIGRGSWVGVPPTDRCAPLRFGPYWIVSMAHAGDLCSAVSVTKLIRIGHARLTEAAQ